ncbi:hypothetical protein [Aliiroseovarius sp. YM-037]|uniref:hypothetical protein n=1 Tax=Aliiroseovarius sp. YM-037 TaxID=3341728 RepID=UPI003A812A3B
MFVDNPGAWLTLLTALIVWHFTEFKQSEELGTQNTSQNDIRVARELVELHAGDFRYLLNDTDLWSFVPSEIYHRLGRICDRWERGTFFFHNRTLNRDLSELIDRLNTLDMKIAQDTVPKLIGGEFRTGYKPFNLVSDDEYRRLRNESKTANEIASQAWKLLDQIVAKIRMGIPEVLDEPID